MRLLPGDEVLEGTQKCDWCPEVVDVDDIIVTNDGSEICPDCARHYDSNV